MPALVLLDGVVGDPATLGGNSNCRSTLLHGLESNSTPVVPELTPFTISVKSGEVGSILMKCCSSSDCSAINCEDDSLVKRGLRQPFSDFSVSLVDFLFGRLPSELLALLFFIINVVASFLSLLWEAVVSVMPMPSTKPPPESSCCCSKPACAITASQSICVPSLAATTTAPLESIPCVNFCLFAGYYIYLFIRFEYVVDGEKAKGGRLVFGSSFI
uniref:Uncharacterized protein n=1 Tax=Glossina austeni TaxID=7395 RepID=A0A1A9VVC6_GLOAU